MFLGDYIMGYYHNHIIMLLWFRIISVCRTTLSIYCKKWWTSVHILWFLVQSSFDMSQDRKALWLYPIPCWICVMYVIYLCMLSKTSGIYHGARCHFQTICLHLPGMFLRFELNRVQFRRKKRSQQVWSSILEVCGLSCCLALGGFGVLKSVFLALEFCKG